MMHVNKDKKIIDKLDVSESLDLKNLVSDPTKLKTYDTHISPEEAYTRLKKGQKAEYLVRAVAKDPEFAYDYAQYVLKGPFPLAEPIIAKYPGYAYYYAMNVLNGPFPLGEPAIAKNPHIAYKYAQYVLKGPFPLGEPEIATQSFWKEEYEEGVLKGRPWTGLDLKKKTTEALDLKNLVDDPTKLKTYDTHIGPKEAYTRLLKGDKDPVLVKIVAKDPRYAYDYADEVLKGPFPLAEPIIAKHPGYAYLYATDVLKGPFLLGEPTIAKHPVYASYYAEYVLKGRPWTGLKKKTTEAIDLKNLVSDPTKLKTYDTHISPEEAYTRLKNGDKDPVLVRAVAKSPRYAYYYAKDILKGPFSLGEPIIAKHPGYSYSYALYVLKGPFTLGEPAIAKHPGYAYGYARYVLKGPFPLGEPTIAMDDSWKQRYQERVLKGRPWTGLDQKVDESLDLKNLVSDPKKLKTYKTHISPEEAYTRLMKGQKAEYLVRAVAKDPEFAFAYAYYVLNGRFPLGEPAIAKSSKYACYYARYVLEKPFPLGEPAIAKDAEDAYWYADDILEGPFPLGEPAIYQDRYFKSQYERDILRDRPWTGLKKKTTEALDLKNLVDDPTKLKTYDTHISPKEAYDRLLKGDKDPVLVKVVAKDTIWATYYANIILKGPFPLAEPIIAKHPGYAYYYARDALKGPFPLGEPAIATNGYWKQRYQKEVLKGRPWTGLDQKVDESLDLKNLVSDPTKLKTYDTHIGPKEAYARLKKRDKDPVLVKVVAKSVDYAYQYARFVLKGPFPLGEPIIAKHPGHSYSYALYVLKGPFPLGEPAIAKHPGYSYWYAINVLKGPFPLGEPAIAKDHSFDYAKEVLKGRPWTGLKKETTEALDLKNLVSDPTKLKTYDTHIGPKEAYERLLKGDKDPVLVKVVAKDPRYAYDYANEVLKGPFKLAEPIIAKDPTYAHYYARDALHGPFLLGEPIIAKHAMVAYQYARDILKGPFPLGEPAIATDDFWKQRYQEQVLKGRPWTGLKKETTEAIDLKNLVSDPTKLKTYHTHISPREAYEELSDGKYSDALVDVLMKDIHHTFLYVKNVLKKPLPQAEPMFAKDGYYSLGYAKVLGKPFPLGEPAIAKYPTTSTEYAYDVLKGRFLLGEPAIATSAMFALEYAKNILQGRFIEAEPKISEYATFALAYAVDVINGRFELGEPMLAGIPEYAAQYAVHALKHRFPLGEPAIKQDKRWKKYYIKNLKLGTELNESIDLKSLVTNRKKLKTNKTHIGPTELFKKLGNVKDEKTLDRYISVLSKVRGFEWIYNIKTSPHSALYVCTVLGKPIKVLEPVISTDVETSWLYAKHELQGPFPLGEPMIATSPGYSLRYAKDILKGRFEMGEPAILSSIHGLLEYIMTVIKGPWPIAEPMIATTAWYSYYYAYKILKGPFPLGEPAIAEDPNNALSYATDVLKGPFPLGEPNISRSVYRQQYEEEILKGRPFTFDSMEKDK